MATFALFQPTRASLVWKDGLQREAVSDDLAGVHWIDGGLVCKRKLDVVTFITTWFRVANTKASPLKLTNEAANDPTACRFIPIQFYYGKPEEVGRIARQGRVYIIYRLRLINDDIGEPQYTDPYPQYGYIFHVESLD